MAAPADSKFAVLAAAAGYPVAVVPFPSLLTPVVDPVFTPVDPVASVSVEKDEQKQGVSRPMGLTICTRPGREDVLFRSMEVWEDVVCSTEERPTPYWVR